MNRIARLAGSAGIAIAPSLVAIGAQAAAFTGPVSPYYLDNYGDHRIYVVQGPSVINSFPWAYSAGNAAPSNEGILAVTNVVTTNGFGSEFGSPATAGQYTLGGTPTGVGHVAQATPGFTAEFQFDGTSDGRHNYTVQFEALDGSGNVTENVIRTDLNWQNPTSLFSALSPPGGGGDKLGITYDPTNNSLWISGWGLTTIDDYSLSGSLLSSFDTGQSELGALALDHADNTLWISSGQSNTLEQWSKSGALLQSGIPSGLPGGSYVAGEFPIPEPASLALLGIGLITLEAARRKRRGNAVPR